MIRRLLICIIEWAVKTFWLIPVDERRITFVSFNGTQYSDSPKYIYEELLKTKNYKYTWIATDAIKPYIAGNPEIVKKGSLSEIIRMATSKCIITNNYLRTFIPIRNKQVVLNTWHGCGVIKRVGLMMPQITHYDRWFFKEHEKKYSAFTSDSMVSEELLLKKSFGFQGEVLRFGSPRNAILLNENNVLREKIREKFDFGDSIIVLYAPTFRGSAAQGRFIGESQHLDSGRVQEAISKKYNKRCRILFRGHHTFKTSTAKGMEDVSDYPDIQELLLACDILISDYSSCMWDMSLQYKPVFVYAPDICEYKRERGFYTEPEEWPFSISKSTDELIESIQRHDDNEYKKKVEAFLESVKSYEKKESLKKTCDWIENKMNCD